MRRGRVAVCEEGERVSKEEERSSVCGGGEERCVRRRRRAVCEEGERSSF